MGCNSNVPSAMSQARANISFPLIRLFPGATAGRPSEGGPGKQSRLHHPLLYNPPHRCHQPPHPLGAGIPPRCSQLPPCESPLEGAGSVLPPGGSGRRGEMLELLVGPSATSAGRQLQHLSPAAGYLWGRTDRQPPSGWRKRRSELRG